MLPDDQLSGQCDDFQAAKPDAFGVGDVLLRVAADDVFLKRLEKRSLTHSIFNFPLLDAYRRSMCCNSDCRW